MRSFITTDSYTDNSLFKILIAWRFQFLIIFVLFCLVILFFWWKQYIKNLSVNQNLKKGLTFETLTDDTVRKIPLQTSASNRRMLVSKSFKTNNKKSLKSNKVVQKITRVRNLLFFLCFTLKDFIRISFISHVEQQKMVHQLILHQQS
jgi:hypothetical protein